MGIMTRCKITDVCIQKSIEIVCIHSVEAGQGVARKRVYVHINAFITSCCDVTTSTCYTHA